MRIKLLLVLSLLLYAFSSTKAHHIINGVILNSEDLSPLVGAVIQIDNTLTAAITNESGYFEIAVEELHTKLIVSFIGFQKQEIEVSDLERNIKILMHPSTIEIGQVQISSNQINSVNTISKIDVNLRPLNSSQEILRIVPGLFIAQHAGGGKAEQIFLRGFDTDHGTDINITSDGMPVNLVSHAHGQGYADMHFIIPELINTVDFGKGPYYSEKGNFATGGYVGINTYNSLSKSMIKMEGGQFNTLRLLGMFDILGDESKRKGHNAYIASEYYLTDGPFESPQNFNRLNLFAKYTGYFKNNSFLSLQASKLSSKWDASGQIPDRAVKTGSITRFGAIDPTEGGYTGRTNLSAIIKTPIGTDLVTENQIFFSRYYFELYSNFTFYLNNPIDGDQIRQREERDIYGLNGSITKQSRFHTALLSSKLGYGIRYDDINDIELTNTSNRDEDIQNLALGNIDETNAWLYVDEKLEYKKWLVNIALRADFFKFESVDKRDTIYSNQAKSKPHFSPKFNLVYNLNRNSRLYLKSGIGFHSNDTRVAVAEETQDIIPSAYGVDLGYSFKPIQNIYANVTTWYLILEQELVYVGDEAVVEPSGKTERKGIDLCLRWQLFSWMFADIDVSYSKAIYLSNPEGENYVPLAPNLTSIGGLTFMSNFGLNACLRYRYMHDRPANEDNSIVALGYTIADLKITYEYKNILLGVSIENLMNAEWNEAQFATLSRLKNEPEPIEELNYTPGIPFFMKFTFSYSF